MASRRLIKKEIDYLISEVVSNCYTCLYFNPDKNRDVVFGIVEDAVKLRNDLIARVKPAEKNNVHLVKKHYTALRNETMVKVDELFSKLSEACK